MSQGQTWQTLYGWHHVLFHILDVVLTYEAMARHAGNNVQVLGSTRDIYLCKYWRKVGCQCTQGSSGESARPDGAVPQKRGSLERRALLQPGTGSTTTDSSRCNALLTAATGRLQGNALFLLGFSRRLMIKFSEIEARSRHVIFWAGYIFIFL